MPDSFLRSLPEGRAQPYDGRQRAPVCAGKGESADMIVQVRNLVKRYNETLAVDNLSMGIKAGEIFGLLGPNGAGKTTTINALIGMTAADGGEIAIFGQDFRGHELEIKRRMGIVPQEIAVYDDLTAYENLDYFGRLYGLNGKQLKDRIHETLAFTGLVDQLGKYPKRFSGGMKRRLNIACALVHQPELIFMDEPTVGIDPQSRNHILESIRELNRRGATIVYTSHYMEEVEELCHQIAIMDHGRIIAGGTKEDLKAMVAVEERVAIELASVNYTLVDRIKATSGVKDCLVDGGRVLVVSQKNSGNLGRIIDCVAETGGELLAVEIERPTLESVFLTLTGRSLRNGEVRG